MRRSTGRRSAPPLDDTPPVGAIGRGVRARRDPGGVRVRRYEGYEEDLVRGAGGGAGRGARAGARGVRGAHRVRLR
ncbi:hypothetical protein P405_07315 [Streptomyces sp. FR-008]|nr:hypothetical protein P405_07315 [Streptomyces sp. FR-008]